MMKIRIPFYKYNFKYDEVSYVSLEFFEFLLLNIFVTKNSNNNLNTIKEALLDKANIHERNDVIFEKTFENLVKNKSIELDPPVSIDDFSEINLSNITVNKQIVQLFNKKKFYQFDLLNDSNEVKKEHRKKECDIFYSMKFNKVDDVPENNKEIININVPNDKDEVIIEREEEIITNYLIENDNNKAVLNFALKSKTCNLGEMNIDSFKIYYKNNDIYIGSENKIVKDFFEWLEEDFRERKEFFDTFILSYFEDESIVFDDEFIQRNHLKITDIDKEKIENLFNKRYYHEYLNILKNGKIIEGSDSFYYLNNNFYNISKTKVNVKIFNGDYSNELGIEKSINIINELNENDVINNVFPIVNPFFFLSNFSKPWCIKYSEWIVKNRKITDLDENTISGVHKFITESNDQKLKEKFWKDFENNKKHILSLLTHEVSYEFLNYILKNEPTLLVSINWNSIQLNYYDYINKATNLLKNCKKELLNILDHKKMFKSLSLPRLFNEINDEYDSMKKLYNQIKNADSSKLELPTINDWNHKIQDCKYNWLFETLIIDIRVEISEKSKEKDDILRNNNITLSHEIRISLEGHIDKINNSSNNSTQKVNKISRENLKNLFKSLKLSKEDENKIINNILDNNKTANKYHHYEGASEDSKILYEDQQKLINFKKYIQNLLNKLKQK
ncbi:hypothetical protein [Mycoplasmopsis adleri]|uniref:hypothetical protein n=1 Tax=Mycoplasmopsis adleri TaxID=51362 RepID=UPI0038735AB8